MDSSTAFLGPQFLDRLLAPVMPMMMGRTDSRLASLIDERVTMLNERQRQGVPVIAQGGSEHGGIPISIGEGDGITGKRKCPGLREC